jgi:hypothetical protein
MLKTYRIIPLVFILFFFGFTLITVAPVSAFGAPDMQHKMERNMRIQENPGKVQAEDRNVCNGLSTKWAEMRMESRGCSERKQGAPWIRMPGWDASCKLAIGQRSVSGSRSAQTQNTKEINAVFGVRGVGGLKQKVFDACMQNRAKGCTTTDKWFNGRLVFNAWQCGGGGYTIDESMYIDKRTGKMHKR